MIDPMEPFHCEEKTYTRKCICQFFIIIFLKTVFQFHMGQYVP